MDAAAEESMPALMDRLGDIFEKVAENPNMPVQIYSLFSIVSKILFEYKTALESGQTTGWADKIQLDDGTAAFQPHEARMLENAVTPMADNVRALFAAPPSQKGFNARGGAKFSLPSLKVPSQAPNPSLKAPNPSLKAPSPSLSASSPSSIASSAQALTGVMKDYSNLSLDYLVETVAEYIDKLNTTSKHIAEKAGILRFEKSFPIIPIPTPFAGVPLQVPTRMLVLVLQGVLEFIRISFAFSESWAGALARIFTSIGSALLEAGKGDWKSALFTIMGVLSGQMVLVGAVGKMLVKILSFISDDISSQLGWAAYDSAKSWMAGIWIFVFSVFAPMPMRGLVELHLEELNRIIDVINQKMGETVGALERNPAFSCHDIKWEQQGPIDFTSLDRLQNLMNNPGFYCSKEIQSLIAGLKSNPPVRIILELLGMPTTEKGITRMCAKLPAHLVGQNLGATLIDGLEPEVVLKSPAPAGCENPPSVEAVRQTLAGIFAPGGRPTS
jgi:hypothetical protein